MGDCSSGMGYFMGRYGNGERNSNGERLLQFIIDSDLFACDTSFKDRA